MLKYGRCNRFFGSVLCIALVLTLLTAAASAQTSGNLPRGSRFTVTITGQPNTQYYVWDAGTFSLSGAPGDRPPIILETLNVQKDPSDGPYVIGMHTISGGGTILDDVTPSTPGAPATDYYALVTTDANGQAIVEFSTSSNTATRRFAIKVEDQGGNPGQLQVSSQLYPRTAPPTTVPTTIPTTIPLPVFTTTLPSAVPSTPPVTILMTTTPHLPPTLPTIPTPLPVAIPFLGIIIACAILARR